MRKSKRGYSDQITIHQNPQRTQTYCGWRSQHERENKNAKKRYKKKKDEEDRVCEKIKIKRPKSY